MRSGLLTLVRRRCRQSGPLSYKVVRVGWKFGLGAEKASEESEADRVLAAAAKISHDRGHRCGELRYLIGALHQLTTGPRQLSAATRPTRGLVRGYELFEPYTRAAQSGLNAHLTTSSICFTADNLLRSYCWLI